MAMDSFGNVYVTGESYGGGTWYDYATVKYDASGNQIWIARYNGPGNDADYAYALALDDIGNICVTGGSYGGGTNFDFATVKYDPAGHQIWVTRYNGRQMTLMAPNPCLRRQRQYLRHGRKPHQRDIL